MAPTPPPPPAPWPPAPPLPADASIAEDEHAAPRIPQRHVRTASRTSMKGFCHIAARRSKPRCEDLLAALRGPRRGVRSLLCRRPTAVRDHSVDLGLGEAVGLEGALEVGQLDRRGAGDRIFGALEQKDLGARPPRGLDRRSERLRSGRDLIGGGFGLILGELGMDTRL